MASIIDLYVDQGSDFYAEIQLQNDNNLIIDLTDFSVFSQFRKSPGSPIYYSFDAVVIGLPVLGTISLSLPGEVSSNIKSGRYLYDVEIINNINNNRLRVVEGVVIITPEITRVDLG
ncbi:hypothetical protein EBU95_17605 [bacterium]|nr:hypothetical protein [bacterium]